MSNGVLAAVKRAVAAETKARESLDPSGYAAARKAYHDASMVAYEAMNAHAVMTEEWERLSVLAKDLSNAADDMKRRADKLIIDGYPAREDR